MNSIWVSGTQSPNRRQTVVVRLYRICDLFLTARSVLDVFALQNNQGIGHFRTEFQGETLILGRFIGQQVLSGLPINSALRA